MISGFASAVRRARALLGAGKSAARPAAVSQSRNSSVPARDSRFARLALGVAAAFALCLPSAAWAQSAGCTTVNSGALNYSVSINGTTTTVTSPPPAPGATYDTSGHATNGNRYLLSNAVFAAGEKLQFTVTLDGSTTVTNSDAMGYIRYQSSGENVVSPSQFNRNGGTYTTNAMLGGTYNISAYLDYYNNAGAHTASIAVSCISPTPTIGSISPNEGAAGATAPAQVTITGTNFSATNNSVSFGGVNGSISSQSATSITVTPPANATAGLVNVVVTNNTASTSATAVNGYRYVAPPTISAAFSPTSIAAGSGTSTLTLTITNPNAVTLNKLSIASAALPANLAGSSPGTSCPNAMASFSGSSLSWGGGSLGAGASCVVTLSVASNTPGTYSYTTGAISAIGTDTTGFVLNGGTATTPTALTVTAPAPTVTSVSPSAGSTAGGNSVVITGSGFTGTTKVSFGSTALASGTYTIDSDTQITATAPAGSAGTVNVIVSTPVGASAAAAGNQYTYVTPPAAPVVTGPADGASVGTLPTYSGTSGASGLTMTVYVDGASIGTTTSGVGGNWSKAQPTALSVGSHTVYAVATDSNGISSAASATNNFTSVAAPTVSEISPIRGATVGGTSVTITGTNFTGATQVLFGPTAATSFTVVSPTQIDAISPARPAGVILVRVVNQGGTSSETISFQYVAAPTVTAISPGSGPEAGGTSVVIQGTFNTPSAVMFGSTPAQSFTYNGAQITAVSPPGTGTVDITVTDAGGTSSAAGTANDYTYVPAPTVTGLSPTQGPAAGGTTVVLTGTNFTGATAVTFGATAAASFTVDSANQITATAPAGTGTVNVRVTTAGGTSPTGAGNQYTFVAAPVASSFTYGSIVPYNVGGDPATVFNLSSQVTGSPTSYAVGSATTSGGGSVSIDNSGEVSYTPPVGYRGNDSFTYTATNAGGTSAPATVTITVGDPTFAIALAGSGTRGTALSGVQVNTTGGAAPYACGTAVASGALPAGTQLNSDCTITGTPTASGSFNFTVTVTDSSTGTGPFSQTSGTLTLIIAAPPVTIVTGPATGTAVGASYSQANTASGGTLPYTYNVASGALPPGTGLNDATGLVSGTPTVAGDYSYSIRVNDDNGNGPAVTGQVVNVTIAKGDQTISFTSTAPPAATVGGATYTPTATATSGLPVAFTIDPSSSGVCAISGGSVSFAGAGTCTINANQAGNANWNAAPQAQQSFAVGQGGQTISFTSTPPSPAQVGGTYAPTATASSGLPVTFTINASTSGNCSISGGVVSFNAAGPCTINADQAGDANYLAAPQVQQGFTIGQGGQTISFTSTPPSPAQVGGTYAPTATASSGLPVGFTIDPSASGVCTISGGTVTFTGVGSCVINANQPGNANYAAAPQVQQSFAVGQGAQTISFTSAAPAGASVGGAYMPTATATSGLPVGFTIDPSSSGVCTISGGTVSFTGVGTCTVNADQPGNADYAAAPRVQQSFPVGAPAIFLLPEALPGATVGSAYNETISASGGSGPYSFTVTAGALPAGLTLAPDGTLSGTPTAAGTFNFTVTATDSSGGTGPYSGSRSYALAVAAPTLALAPTTLPAATVGEAYSENVTASGGTAPYSYAVTAGALPPGMTLSSAGLISGTPTGGGTYNFTVTATDSSTGAGAPYSVGRAYSLVVDAPVIALAPATLPSAAVGATYSQTVTASGGIAPYTYSVTAGALPGGLTLAPDGTLSGTPIAGGTFNFTVTATDSSTGGSPFSGSRAYSLVVAAPTLTLAPATLPAGQAGAAYSAAITASGGTAPYSYALTAGALPAGLILAADGTLSGTPASFGTFNFTVTATDSSGGTGPYTASRAYTLTIAAPTLTIVPAAPSGTRVGASYSQANPASGGVAPYTYALASGTLPAGTALDPVTGTVSGTPTTAGPFSYAIRVTDSQPTPASATGATVSGTIAASDQSIAFTSTPPSPAVVGGTYTPTATASSGLPVTFTVAPSASGVCTISGGTVTFTGAGTCVVNANQPGNANYSAAPRVQQSFAIGQASQTITFTSTPPSPATVGGSYTPTATSTSGLPVAFTIAPSASGVCTISGGTVTFTGAGTCIVNANQPGNANYSAAPQVQQSFAVGRRAQTIAFTSTPPSPAQVGNSYTPTATASSGLPVAFSIAPASSGVCSISGGTVTFNAVGECVINANQAGDATFDPAPQAQQSVTVSTPAPPQARSLATPASVQNGPGASVSIDLTPLVSGDVTDVVVNSGPSNGTVTIGRTGNSYIAVYRPAAGYAGPDSFTFRAIGPGGSSGPATVPIQVIAAVPTAAPRTANVLAGRPLTVDLTGSATGSPFTGGAIVSVTPADAADVRLVESGPAGNRSYSVEFTSRGAFASTVTILYTLSNAGGTSQPLTLTAVVEARPDPSADAEVVGLESAQTGAARRMAETQIRNFGRRLEQLHADTPNGGGVAINIAPGIPMRGVDPQTDAAYADPTQLDDYDPRGLSAPHRGLSPAQAAALGRPRGGSTGYEAASTDGAPRAASDPLAAAAAGPSDTAAAPTQRQPGSLELWANGTVTVGHRDPVTGEDEFSITTAGITGGGDIKIADGAVIGVGAGYGADQTDVGDNGTHLDARSWVVGAYGSFRPVDGAFVDVVLGTGGLDFDLTRYVTATGTLARGQRSGDLLFGSLTAGIDRRSNRMRWSLYGGLEASRAELGSYVEQGPLGYSLFYDERSIESLSSLLGGRFELERMSRGTVLLPRGRIEYRHEFQDAAGQRVQFSDWLAGPTYVIDADGWSRNRLAVELGLGLRLRSGWQLGFDLQGEVSGNSRSVGARVDISIDF